MWCFCCSGDLLQVCRCCLHWPCQHSCPLSLHQPNLLWRGDFIHYTWCTVHNYVVNRVSNVLHPSRPINVYPLRMYMRWSEFCAPQCLLYWHRSTEVILRQFTIITYSSDKSFYLTSRLTIMYVRKLFVHVKAHYGPGTVEPWYNDRKDVGYTDKFGILKK